MIRERIKHDRAHSYKSYTSLRIAMLSNLLFALGVGIAVFLLVGLLSRHVIDRRYLDESKVEDRIEEYTDELQNYVNDENISSTDLLKIAKWADKNKYLYMAVYKDDVLVYETGMEVKKTAKTVENKENADDSTGKTVENAGFGVTGRAPNQDELDLNTKGPYVILAADGEMEVMFADYSEYLYYDIFKVVAIILAFASFLLVMWFYFFELTRKISRLGREVTAVADGDVNRAITADGDDELTRLCSDVEYMRISMLENIEKEHAALEANRELITAMSHDIRTPLTVLLGYLDIMKSYSNDPDMQQYLETSERTAMRLKKMSDDMFGYFLVYGGGIEVEVQECDARTLVDQMLSGHVFLLREQGYTIDFNFEEKDNAFLSEVIVVTDPPQLMRIVENLFSNVMKYADKEKPVTVFVDSETDEMTIKVSNYALANPDETQKNGIGLRSCMKLANAMDIRFSSEEEDGVFTSVLNVPIIPSIAYSEPDNDNEKRGFTEWLKSIFTKFKNTSSSLWKKFKDFVTRKE